MRDSLLLVEPLIRILSWIRLIRLCLIGLSASASCLRLRLSVSSTSDSDLLAAHGTIPATVLDQLDGAELVEEVTAGQLSGSDHLVLADGAVLELADFTCQNSLAASILRNTISIILKMRWLLARRVLLYLKLDQWEITFQSLHEVAELDVFRNISAYFLKILVELLAKEEVIEQTQVEAAHEDEEAQVEQVQQVCHEIQEEFDLNQVNFCLVVVLDRLLSVACFLVVCRSLLLLIFYDPDSGCLVLLEAVDVCMAKDLSAKDVHQAVVG